MPKAKVSIGLGIPADEGKWAGGAGGLVTGADNQLYLLFQVIIFVFNYFNNILKVFTFGHFHFEL